MDIRSLRILKASRRVASENRRLVEVIREQDTLLDMRRPVIHEVLPQRELVKALEKEILELKTALSQIYATLKLSKHTEDK